MKLKTLLVVALAASVPALACAKKPKKAAEEAPVQAAAVVEEEEPTITEECVINVSLFHVRRRVWSLVGSIYDLSERQQVDLHGWRKDCGGVVSSYFRSGRERAFG